MYALLQLTPFVCTVIHIDKFYIQYCKKSSISYALFSLKVFYELLQVTTFVCTIAMDNFFMHCYIWQQQLLTFSCIIPLQLHYIITIADLYWYFCNQLLLYALFKLLTSVYTTSNENICMHYCTWELSYTLLQLTTFAWIVAIEEFDTKTIRNIDYNNMNNE